MNIKRFSFVCSRSILIWGFFFFWFAFSHITAGYGYERKTPLVLPPQPLYNNPFLTKGTSGFCLIQYDHDSLVYYWNGFGKNNGIAVYMDPAICSSDSVYPFKITNVHFYLDGPEGFTWPVGLNVNIRQARAPEDSIKIPGAILFTKSYNIPSDSGYVFYGIPHPPINLSLDTTFCVTSPFFLEIIYTGPADSGYASLWMSDKTDVPDTNQDWLVLGQKYYRWDTAWVAYDTPGRPIMRVTGYPKAIDCSSCWYWKPPGTRAPSGTPDFDQYQFETDTVAFDAPSAVADGLVWLRAAPLGINPDSLIRLLSDYFHTIPSIGGETDVDSIRVGLDSFFVENGLNFYSNIIHKPTFIAMTDSLKKSESIILLLGLWQEIDGTWYRIGGHYVSMAGTCYGSSQLAISDPAFDQTESGAKGRILPSHDPHPDNHILHNTAGFVSQDMYVSDTLTIGTLGKLWRLKDYYGGNLPWLSGFEGQNFQPDQAVYSHAYDSTKSLYAVVEYAVLIFPKPSAVGEDQVETPKDFELSQSYPNPFNSQTMIKYSLSKPAQVSISIFNILGQRVRTLVKDERQNGAMSVIWNGKNDQGREVSSGIYFYQLKAGEYSQTRRMVLLK